MGNAAPQITQAECARFRQTISDLVFCEIPCRCQVGGDRFARCGGFDYSLRQDADLRFGHQRDLHRPFENLRQNVVKPDRSGNDIDPSAKYLSDAACGLAEKQLLGPGQGDCLPRQPSID